MTRKRSPLLVQVLLFLLVTLLGVATGTARGQHDGGCALAER